MKISSGAWKKQQPPGLKKSGSTMEKAMAEVEKAEKGLDGKGEAGAKVMEKALDALEKAAKAVAAECKDLEKKEKDKKAKKALADCQASVTKALGKEIAALRDKVGEAIKAAAEGADGGGDKDDVFSTPEAHAAYIKKWATKLKKGKLKFAVGLPSNKPEEMRFNFHPKKAGRGLAGVLKKKAGAKKFTFGQAGADALAAELGVEDLAGRTLVLNVEGKKIPALAKRVRLMFRTIGVSQFAKVKVFANGQEIDGADEDTPEDMALEEMDLETEDEDDVVEMEDDDLEEPMVPDDDEEEEEDARGPAAGEMETAEARGPAGGDGAVPPPTDTDTSDGPPPPSDGSDTREDPEVEERRNKFRSEIEKLEAEIDALSKELA